MKTLATKNSSKDYSPRQQVQVQSSASLRSPNPSPLSTGMPLLQRQCACGGGCPRCQEKLGIQTKLKISEPGDQYEQEADRIADEVMRMSELSVQNQVEPEAEGELQKPSMAQEEEEKETLQTKPLAEQIIPLVQRQTELIEEEEEKTLQTKTTSDQVTTVSSSLENRIKALQGGGQPLPRSERAFFEPRFGADFSQVRVHTDSQAVEACDTVNARAFTIGRNVVFGAGQYQPRSSEGQRLLAHELTHVVQQGQSSQKNWVQRLVNPSRVSCNGYPRTYPIFRAIGTDDPVGALQAADARAIEVLSNTIDSLTSTRARIQAGEPPAWPTINDCMAQSMRIRLLINPDDRNSWTRTGPGTVERAIRMLTNLRGVFQGGNIRYSCLGRGCEPGDDAFVQDGEGYLIHLCRGFWDMEDTDYRAIVLIHELAHIYYHTEDRGFLGLGSSYCIEGFLNDLNNIDVPEIYQADCRGDQVDAC